MTVLASPHLRPILLAEHFGPTLQGEGPSTGQQALFIRLSRCNLTCPGCDTPYTWDWTRFDPHQETTRVSLEQLYDWTASHPEPMIVITGGEPLLQQDRILPLLRGLVHDGRRIEIETNGTVTPGSDLIELVTQFNVSPKTSTFAGTGTDEDKRINPEAMQAFTASGKAIFKFVVSHREDLDEVSRYQQKFGLTPVWVMPEGTSAKAVLDRMTWLADEAIHRGWNLSPRLQTLVWGGERGR